MEDYFYKCKREISPGFKYKEVSVKYFLKYISYNVRLDNIYLWIGPSTQQLLQ
jgi:hypothetical protein